MLFPCRFFFVLHTKSQHFSMLKCQVFLVVKTLTGSTEGIVVPSKEGLMTMTVTLKWCTPKSNVVGLYCVLSNIIPELSGYILDCQHQ